MQSRLHLFVLVFWICIIYAGTTLSSSTEDGRIEIGFEVADLIAGLQQQLLAQSTNHSAEQIDNMQHISDKFHHLNLGHDSYKQGDQRQQQQEQQQQQQQQQQQGRVSSQTDGRPSSIFAYPVPPFYARSSIFTIRINQQDDVFIHGFYEYDYSHFGLLHNNQEIFVSINVSEKIISHSITPWKLGIQAHVDNNNISFKVKASQYLIIKINNLKELVLFIDPPECDPPDWNSADVINVASEPYNADTTGRNGMATDSIQRAIGEACKRGGGTVAIPPGVYYVGNLMLKSNVHLYISPGAYLIYTGRKSDYKVYGNKVSLKSDLTWWIWTQFGSENVTVSGRGTMDARGKELHGKGDNLDVHHVVPIDTKNFVFDGPLIRDAAIWAVIPSMSENVTLRNLKIANCLDMVENDGVDVMHCRNVYVDHAWCAAGDDCFSLKTWRASGELTRSFPPNKYSANTNIVFNDTVAWSTCIAYKIGYGNFKDTIGVSFLHNTVYKAAVAIGIDSKYAVDGALIRNILWQDTVIEHVFKGRGLLFGGWLSIVTRKNSNDGGLSQISNITVKDTRILDYGGFGGIIKGYSPQFKINNVTIENAIPPGKNEPAKSLEELKVAHQYSNNNRVI
ncbi:pectin lyase fold/virulence factor [Lipomyces japonicus]|uniref:pectin lyase fold/virulence factor n=1 Tax=Lipomyces japonicus TaxID=56871 RepID=UPI0034CE7DDA